jgi:hypothetical protein
MLTSEQAKNIRGLLIRVVATAHQKQEIDDQEDEAIMEYIANCEAALKLWNQEYYADDGGRS